MSAAGRGTLYILIGKLASGKSTYARSLPACFTLSADRWMRALFPEGCGPLHEQYSERVFALLREDARALTVLGQNVILDTGMWTRANRAQAMEAFAGIDTRWIWLDPPEAERRRHAEGKRRSPRLHAPVSQALSRAKGADDLPARLSRRPRPRLSGGHPRSEQKQLVLHPGRIPPYPRGNAKMRDVFQRRRHVRGRVGTCSLTFSPA